MSLATIFFDAFYWTAVHRRYFPLPTSASLQFHHTQKSPPPPLPCTSSPLLLLTSLRRLTTAISLLHRTRSPSVFLPSLSNKSLTCSTPSPLAHSFVAAKTMRGLLRHSTLRRDLSLATGVAAYFPGIPAATLWHAQLEL